MNFMVNQMNKLQKNRKNKNKGFTLVELIIVIAIIAVLAAVLAPQYIQYVEKSRIGVDESYISEVAHNMELTAASSEAAMNKAAVVTFDTTGEYFVAGDASTPIEEGLNSVFPTFKAFKSKEYSTDANIAAVKLTLDTTGHVKIEGTKNLNRS